MTELNALKCESLACSAFIKHCRSYNSEQAGTDIIIDMCMLAQVYFSSYNNVFAWLFTYLLVVF